MKIVKIWYEFDEWAAEFDPNDANADVCFVLEDGTMWCAAFYTYRYLMTLAAKKRQSGECLSGSYFAADKPIFIEKMTKETIIAVLNDLLQTESELSAVFTPAEG